MSSMSLRMNDRELNDEDAQEDEEEDVSNPDEFDEPEDER